MALNDCRLLLHNIAKKLNRHHSSIDVFFENDKKLEIIIKKKVVAIREKPLHLKIQKLLEQLNNSTLQHHNILKIS